MTVKDAKKALKEVELEIKISNNYEGMKESEVVIGEQLPMAGITQDKGGYVVCEIK